FLLLSFLSSSSTSLTSIHSFTPSLSSTLLSITMLSFKFILILVFGLFIQTALTDPRASTVTTYDNKDELRVREDGFTTAVSDNFVGSDTGSEIVSDTGYDTGSYDLTLDISSADTHAAPKPTKCYGTCSASRMCRCRRGKTRIYCGCDNPGGRCSCGSVGVISRDIDEGVGVDNSDDNPVVDEGVTTPDVNGVDNTSDDGTSSDDDDDELDTDTDTDTSSDGSLSNKRPGKCVGVCGQFGCRCKGRNVFARCHCDKVGEKCSCTGPWVRAVDDEDVTKANNTAVSDVEDTTSVQDDDLDFTPSSVDNLMIPKPKLCHGMMCSKDKKCHCKYAAYHVSCPCKNPGRPCYCKSARRDLGASGDNDTINATAIEEGVAVSDDDVPETSGLDSADDTNGVSPSNRFVPPPPAKVCRNICDLNHKCHCRSPGFSAVCPCRIPGFPCTCTGPHLKTRADDNDTETEAATVDEDPTLAVQDNTPEDAAKDNDLEEDDQNAEDSETDITPIPDHFNPAPAQRTCYSICNKKKQCSCRGKKCACKHPGERCKCYFPFLPPRDVVDNAEAVHINATAPITTVDDEEEKDANIPIAEPDDAPLTEDDIANTTYEFDDDDEDEIPTATLDATVDDSVDLGTTPNEKSPLIARSQPCWGVCDKYRHCYCGHIRTACDCSKRGHRCYCSSGIIELPPGMTYGPYV
ncbi:uncharacterized protein BO97DRAFT_454014, partial [Aspergillus homomorphus CBS 101889]